MRRIRLLFLLGAVALGLVTGVTSAGATGGSPPANYVTIKDRAQFDFQGTYIHVGLTVKCKANGNPLRTVEVAVRQYYPETPYQQGAFGIGAQNVVCDGVARPVAVTVPVGLFDAGRAWAEAALDPLNTPPTATAKRWITIVHV